MYVPKRADSSIPSVCIGDRLRSEKIVEAGAEADIYRHSAMIAGVIRIHTKGIRHCRNEYF